MFNKEKLIAILNEIKDNELKKGLKPKLNDLEDVIIYQYDEIHFVFINKITLAFNEAKLDENLRLYIGDQATSAIAIENIEEIMMV